MGPSTHGEEFANEGSTNTQRIVDKEFFFADEEFFFVEYSPAKNFELEI